ncbi:sensor histidine kinase [Micromonospora polyrhachis]|uniref:histidine kinase n=1 Tax=Micromonospora polyrhachis TaxID=1282883 RepID=A0A7W7WS24_9ACTN|nr:sensor histidine kinase [Micromonospora polyrhachis]MBB4960933.1 signal transduction histidine kinase [Micromonospora polyrhachis]
MTNAMAVLDRWRWTRALRRVSGPLPRPSLRNWVFDVLLAGFITFGLVHYALTGNISGSHSDGPAEPFDPPLSVPADQPPDPTLLAPADPPDLGYVTFAVALVLFASIPLALRRRYPLGVLWVAIIAAVLTPEAAPRLTFYACVIAAYSAAAYSPYRIATLVSMPVMVLAAGSLTGAGLPTVPNRYVPLLVLLPITVAANGLRTWRQRTDDGRARVEALEREQAEAVRRATELERARIARELHDVVTHNVSMMVIQAGAARKIMDRNPERAREALLAVESGGRAAMTELRHVMGLLTMDGEDADLAPQPGLDQLDELVARVRDAGIAVRLTVAGQVRPVPPGVDLTAYRVVQEALTNTVKHAAGSHATVTITYAFDELSIEVTNTGGTSTPSAATGNGRGLIGLHERLALYGGHLDVTHRPTGGYRVQARIPLEIT